MRHGFLFLDKPAGSTSHDMVALARRALGERSIGHLGTLDPMATGLLVLAVGRKALKVIEFFSGLPKEYVATVRFGAISTTYDRDGVLEAITPPKGLRIPDGIAIHRIIDERLIGKIRQVPPPYSAVHVRGQRAYALARAGKPFELSPRDVTIASCGILSYEYPVLVLRIVCGSGTYVRSLAHDLGKLLRCGGYLEELRRLMVGEWSVADAVPSDCITWAAVRPLRSILASLPRIDLPDEHWRHLQHGQSIPGTLIRTTIGWHAGLPVAILEPGEGGGIRPRKVL